jgi:hypothetical protein
VNTCPNLQDLFGDKYQIGLVPAALTRAEKKDPWLQTIPCRFEVIYPFGEGFLAVDVEHHPKSATRLAGIPGVRLHQDGDGEQSFVIPIGLFPEVARVVRPRRKYRSSPRQLANLMAGTPEVGLERSLDRGKTATGTLPSLSRSGKKCIKPT